MLFRSEISFIQTNSGSVPYIGGAAACFWLYELCAVSYTHLDVYKRQADRKALFEKTGVQFQESNYQEQIRVAELCEVTASLYRNASDPAALLQRFGIGDKGKSLVKDLSGGQRQRLFIVLALIPNPEVVFLDDKLKDWSAEIIEEALLEDLDSAAIVNNKNEKLLRN